MRAMFTTLARTVRHVPEKHQFTCEADKTLLGVLEYRIEDNSIDMYRTFVLPEGRGGGVAKALCDEAFRFAKEKQLNVIPTCSYISETYMKKYVTN
ncbi:hypothetical protein THRCLA_21150 [Thraustotheca clavata]|uniref:N-acetyltransferase domain-containing protein n=1 Tax=Thraustotheca clavata TaxID=74557 RepID=A0A1V9ZZP3_9STRA|nr:hypothetical protein THRCLA_21150 [Thraustotheca clavata]